MISSPKIITSTLLVSFLIKNNAINENIVYIIYINKSKLYISTLSVAFPQNMNAPTKTIITYDITTPNNQYRTNPISNAINW